MIDPTKLNFDSIITNIKLEDLSDKRFEYVNELKDNIEDGYTSTENKYNNIKLHIDRLMNKNNGLYDLIDDQSIDYIIYICNGDDSKVKALLILLLNKANNDFIDMEFVLSFICTYGVINNSTINFIKENVDKINTFNLWKKSYYKK